MESRKIINLLKESYYDILKFATRKWCIINDQNNEQHVQGDENDGTIRIQKLLNQIFVIILMYII